MELIRKDLDFDIRQVGEPESRTLEFIGSDETTDRYGDVIEVDGWDLKNYKKNPVFLWAHDYRQPPVGKALRVWTEDKKLKFRIQFPTAEEYAFADTIFRLYLGGYLKATSVGFKDLEREPIYGEPQGESGHKPVIGYRFTKQELYELSAVPVPANPNALVMAVQKGVVSQEEVNALEDETRGAIPYKGYPADPEEASWDGPAEMKQAEVSDCKKICAWVDPEKADVKGGYKLPHHRAEGYNTVWRGVAAAMAALLGARGGVQIPDGDRKAVYNHLAKHYGQFDKTPPEFKAVGEYGHKELCCIEWGLPTEGGDIWFHASQDIRQLVQDAMKTELSQKDGAVCLTISAVVGEAVRDALEHFLADKTITDWYSQAAKPGDKPQGGGQAREEIDNLITGLTNIKKLI